MKSCSMKYNENERNLRKQLKQKYDTCVQSSTHEREHASHFEALTKLCHLMFSFEQQ